jgi:hypothetical protein
VFYILSFIILSMLLIVQKQFTIVFHMCIYCTLIRSTPFTLSTLQASPIIQQLSVFSLCHLHTQMQCISILFILYWSKLFLALLLLLNLTGANWGVMRDAERTQDRQTERWGQVCWALGWRRQQPYCFFSLYSFLRLLCFFSLSLFFKALVLYNSLKPCFFSIL